MCIIVILTGGEASSGIKIENMGKDEGPGTIVSGHFWPRSRS